MKCPYCQRPVKLFNLQRSNLIKKVLPRCGACHRYALNWVHKSILIAFGLAAFLALLKLLGIL